MDARPLNHSELFSLSEKDEQYYRDWLGNNIHDIIQRLLGVRRWIQFRSAITVLSRFAYYAIPTLSSLPTLGEEFCEANLDEPDKNIPKRLLAILLNNELKLPTEIPRSYANLLIDIHLVTFYLFGDFYELSKRAVGLSYTTKIAELTSSTTSSRTLNKLIGLVSLIKVFMNLPKQLDEARQVDTCNNMEDLIDRETNVHNKTYDQQIICQLCSSIRTEPTSTLCGHIFCWNCIHQWLRQNNECPICRAPNESSRLIHLINFK